MPDKSTLTHFLMPDKSTLTPFYAVDSGSKRADNSHK